MSPFKIDYLAHVIIFIKTFWILLTKLGPKINFLHQFFKLYLVLLFWLKILKKILLEKKKAFHRFLDKNRQWNRKFWIVWEVGSSEFFSLGLFNLVLMVKSFFFSKYEIFIFFNFSSFYDLDQNNLKIPKKIHHFFLKI